MENLRSPAVPVSQNSLSQKWIILVAVMFGIFMVILDTTVVNVAFQTIRTEFNASLNDAQWIISVYVLALGISTPLSGYLADRFGMKKVYLTGIAIFAAGSFICGLSPSLPVLIAARTLQGLGGGIAVPLGSAMLLRTFPPSEQGFALGIFGIVLLVAPALGPILGGFLVDQNLWRLIFFINPPIGLLGFILGSRVLPKFKDDRQPSFDVWGLVTEIIGFGSILYAASTAANKGWSSPDVITFLVTGVVGLAVFAIIELKVAREPLLDLRLFKNRVFLNASLLGYVSVIALFGAEFLMPLFLQSLRGKSAFETGLILLPMAITAGVSTIISGRLYDRLGPRPLVAFGFAMLIINTWQLSQIQADTSINYIMLLLALRGLAVGTTVQPTFVTALSVVPLNNIPRGSSLTNATRQVVQSIGVAILATVLASSLSPQISALQQQYLNTVPKQGDPRVAICSASQALNNSNTPLLVVNTIPAQTTPPPGPNSQLLNEVCKENVSGFEKTYTITFYAAIVALLLGVMLPGWPFKWGGRRAADAPPPAAH